VQEVFVAAARGQVPAAEVLAAMSASRNNLPAPVDSFVGRQMELAEITRAVRADRLVTLTGPGGSGKTRLALEIAASLVPEFADGVWLVELAAISDSGRLPGTVAQVLGVSDRPGEALADTLAGWLRDRHLLLSKAIGRHRFRQALALSSTSKRQGSHGSPRGHNGSA
jgi:hypothetical protein